MNIGDDIREKDDAMSIAWYILCLANCFLDLPMLINPEETNCIEEMLVISRAISEVGFDSCMAAFVARCGIVAEIWCKIDPAKYLYFVSKLVLE